MEYCKVERDGHLLIVTINRPHVMNALMSDAHRELSLVWDDFESDDDLWIGIVTGMGDKAFSAGNDMKATAAGVKRDYVPAGFAGFTGRFSLQKPVIAAVNGIAMGGGFELALACDLIVASENAFFALSEPLVGAVALGGGVHRLTRQIPLKQAMGILLTGRRVSAAEGKQLGFVNEVVPAGDALSRARALAAEILRGSPMSLRLTKREAMNGLSIPSLETAFRTQQDVFPQVLASEDFAEGAKAFTEKRAAQWKGR